MKNIFNRVYHIVVVSNSKRNIRWRKGYVVTILQAYLNNALSVQLEHFLWRYEKKDDNKNFSDSASSFH